MGIGVGKMVRALHKLSDAAAKSDRLKPGRHSDGGGLYLNVGPTGTKSWLFMWVPPGGKRKEMGLGAYPTVTLAKARAKASDCRQAVSEGRDPIAEKKREAEPTFGECADRLFDSIKSEWRNAKHRQQWATTLGDGYCSTIRAKRVSQISTDDVLAVLNPIWLSKAETASRIRGRIERVLDFAKVKGWRSGRKPGRLAWSSAQHSPQARQADARPSRRDALREPAGLRRTHSGFGRNGGSRA